MDIQVEAEVEPAWNKDNLFEHLWFKLIDISKLTEGETIWPYKARFITALSYLLIVQTSDQDRIVVDGHLHLS